MMNNKGLVPWLVPLLIGVLAGAVLHQYILPDPVPPSTVPKQAASDFKLMAEAWNAIDENYVDRPSIKPEAMTYGAISGMVESLGDTGHSVFLTPDMVREEGMIETGAFTGIGVEIQMKDNHVVVVAPMDNTPAQRAGVHAGDIILRVDGDDITGVALPQVVKRILGPAGTKVRLTLKDPITGKERDVVIRRAKIPLRSVTWRMLPGSKIAHLRIAFFSNGSSDELVKALDGVDRDGAHGLILDLRNDPGGLLDMAVSVASSFLEKGVVLREKNAKGATQDVPVETGGRKCSLPMAVLINAGTASASEIVAGALQDAGRASLVGETTFGTGTVLKPIPLSDGSAVLLAVREWLTPKGRVIWHKGITPNVVVALPKNVAPLIPEAEDGMTATQLAERKDTQLLRAMDLLRQSGK
jgi:carboxyl-terminal processing protease